VTAQSVTQKTVGRLLKLLYKPMMSKQFKQGHKVVWGVILSLAPPLITFGLLEFINAPSPADSIAKRSKSAVETQVSIFERQLSELNRLHQSAPAVSIEQLTARNIKTDSNLATAVAWNIDNLESSTPKQYRIKVHPSNFGNRLSRDIKGRPVHNALLMVLHETTSAASGAVNTMLTPHPRDQDQVSYHSIIQLDGTIIYTVDPRKRAYGAGDSIFKGAKGAETVQTKKNLDPSVNNFAYHISLETPSDGIQDNHPRHSGYTDEQYDSLAWLVVRSGVSRDRITTHAAIDQSGERQDPRSFEMASLRQNIALQDNTLISLEPTQPQ
jgi:N-acetyl-anhydromuramyl-L-alanine amidase AmpD